MTLKNTAAPSSLQRFVYARPYLFVLLIFLLFVALLLPVSALLKFLPEVVNTLLIEALLVGIGFLLIARLQWWRAVGFTGGNRKGGLIYIVPALALLYPLIPTFFLLILGVAKVSFAQIVSIGVYSLLVGIAEETFFRGLILQALVSKGVLRAVFISGLVFSLAHSLNLLVGADLLGVLQQLILTLGWGIAFGALWVRRESIWPLIIIHFLRDWSALLFQKASITSVAPAAGTPNTTTTSSILLPFLINGAVSVVLLVYSAIILRPGQLQHVRTRFQKATAVVQPWQSESA